MASSATDTDTAAATDTAPEMTVMGADVTEAVRAQLDSETVEVERVGGQPFIGIVTLDSGARLGLTIEASPDDAEPPDAEPPDAEPPDAEPPGTPARWAMAIGETLSAFAPDRAIKFAELIENPRADIEQRIEEAAGELGLPAESVLFSLPVVELVRAMFEKDRPHFSRLSLKWLLPSELRALRADIAALVDNELLPRELRDLAKRLVVPE
jgi:hypothetical protein